MINYVTKLFTTTYETAEADKEENFHNGKQTMITCLLVAICITSIKYYGDSSYLYITADWLGYGNSISKLNYNDSHLYELLWWASILFAFYFIVPTLVIKLIFKQNLSAYGLKIKGAFSDKKIYFLMLLVMIPIVIGVSFTHSFQSKYPFYKVSANENLFGNFLIWELAYFIQFFALEFFFRGFMVHATKKTFGFYSVFVMMIPYCMIHFGKPMPETIAAIIAGIVLGVLSLKSKSIWLGVAIHYSVAITMDIAALWQKGII
jgi:membrane protease YdiL (CAAX protease family)